MTIAGESAGSWSVFHHLLSPTSEGLFRGVIGQSGTMISELADRYMTRLIFKISHTALIFPYYREEAFNNGMLFAQELNCFTDIEWNSTEVEECLRTKTTEELFHAYTTGTFRSRGSVDSFSEFPSVLPDDPDKLLASGSFHKVTN